MTTLADITLQVAKKVTTVIEGLATAGTNTSLTDTVNLTHSNAYWDGGTLWILSGAHAGKVSPVITFAANKLNFLTIGSALCVQQAETLTVLGSVTGSGNATVVVTAAGMPNSPKTLSVAVLNLDSASDVATKIRAAMAADTDINAFFTIGGAGAAIILTVKSAVANDLTMNASVTNGSCTGLTTVANSANTAVGVAGPRYAIARRDIPYGQLVSAINSALDEVTITTEDDTLVGDGTTLEFTLPTGVAHLQEVKFERPGWPDPRFVSNHWEELNGLLRFDNRHAPCDGDTLHLWYLGAHDTLVNYGDDLDDEVNLDWLRAQSTFNVLMWAKALYGDDEDYDIVTRLQVVNQLLLKLARNQYIRVHVRTA